MACLGPSLPRSSRRPAASRWPTSLLIWSCGVLRCGLPEPGDSATPLREEAGGSFLFATLSTFSFGLRDSSPVGLPGAAFPIGWKRGCSFPSPVDRGRTDSNLCRRYLRELRGRSPLGCHSRICSALARRRARSGRRAACLLRDRLFCRASFLPQEEKPSRSLIPSARQHPQARTRRRFRLTRKLLQLLPSGLSRLRNPFR